eukprot:scaffold46674_cov37-Phaeocystis_antarctica.AAC.2
MPSMSASAPKLGGSLPRLEGTEIAGAKAVIGRNAAGAEATETGSAACAAWRTVDAVWGSGG